MYVESIPLETENLRLRPYRADDEEAWVALVTDPDVMRFVGDGPATETRAREVFARVFGIYERGGWAIWAVETRDGRYVGSAEIKPRENCGWEIVYILAKEAWGRGYASEIARELVRFGFDALALPRVLATVDLENAVSIRVLEKAGMRKIAEETDEEGPYGVYGVDRLA
jgi:RimJ/RimL family protein N-acetyltransferase